MAQINVLECILQKNDDSKSNQGKININVSEKDADRSVIMFIYRKKCLLIKMGGATL